MRREGRGPTPNRRRGRGKGEQGGGEGGKGIVEEGTGRGPQFEKNDSPVIGWLVTGLLGTTAGSCRRQRAIETIA